MNTIVLLTAVDIAIPGYRIIRPIGEGGMASVFLAVQESLEREVALKVMSPALAANAEFANRFLIEGKITAQLQHPNLVTIYDIGCHNGLYYLAAEYVPAGTLKERLAAGDLTIAQMLDITSDLAQGLDFAHAKGFVHRDVKPGNILFRKDGRAVLADFGIAKAMDGSNSNTVAGVSLGTPDYMSPEQARGEAVDGRADLYSLGTVLYEMLTGRPPYQGGDAFSIAMMHVTHPVPQLPESYLWLQPLISGLMAKEASKRFKSGAATIEAIQRVVSTAPEALSLTSANSGRFDASARLSRNPATERQTKLRLLTVGGMRSWILAASAAGALGLIALVWAVWSLTAASPAPVGIAADLSQAETYLELGASADGAGRKLIYPENDSALFYYRRVLAEDPGNKAAERGIGELLSYYRHYSGVACGAGQWTDCAAIARMGLKVDPEDTILLANRTAAERGQSGGSPVSTVKPSD